MYQLTSLSFANLAVSQRIAAATPSTPVDLSLFTGNALFVLNASATEAAATTADFKVQHCDTVGGTYTDAPVAAFAQVTNAGASSQKFIASTDGLKKFVRIMPTLGGTSPAVTYGVQVIGKTSLG